MKNFLPRVPFIVVGCKTDLRTDEKALKALAAEGSTPVSTDEVRPTLPLHLVFIFVFSCSSHPKTCFSIPFSLLFFSLSWLVVVLVVLLAVQPCTPSLDDQQGTRREGGRRGSKVELFTFVHAGSGHGHQGGSL